MALDQPRYLTEEAINLFGEYNKIKMETHIFVDSWALDYDTYIFANFI